MMTPSAKKEILISGDVIFSISLLFSASSAQCFKSFTLTVSIEANPE